MTIPHIIRNLRGRWRLWWNLCPECNSDAPELDTCGVCGGRRNWEKIGDSQRKIMWDRFQLLNSLEDAD